MIKKRIRVRFMIRLEVEYQYYGRKVKDSNGKGYGKFL
jgi:hypothetical protein